MRDTQSYPFFTHRTEGNLWDEANIYYSLVSFVGSFEGVEVRRGK